MIFITVGSQKFQFNRLLKEVDELIEQKIINEPVFAQIGVSDYIPKNYEYADFMTQDEFNEKINDSDIVITHGGTGVIINALKRDKKVIAIPRLSKYNEHVDDHQIQLIDEFKQLNLIEPVYEISELESALRTIKDKKYDKYVSNTNEIIKNIKKFIGEWYNVKSKFANKNL